MIIRTNFKTTSLAVLFVILGTNSATSSALTINSVFKTSNESFTVGPATAGNAPTTNTAGSGSLASIFETAINWWESAIQDPHTITIDFGWAPLVGNTLAETWSFISTPKFTHASILFDNDGSSSWFFDPTPTNSAEWNTLSNTSVDLGGGEINTGHIYTNPTGDAAGNSDLLTVALHEIGHALGFNSANLAFNLSNSLLVNGGTYNGTDIPINGPHINLNTTVLSSTLITGHRRLLSELDILAVATTGGFDNFDVTPNPDFAQVTSPVPVPGALLLFGSGLIGLLGLRKRNKI